MNNTTELALIKSEQFGEIRADIYSNNGEVFMTISQLAECLGYAARRGVEMIVSRNPYLENEEFSVTHELCATDGKSYNTRLFTEDGIYEVTMLSSQPKAAEFRAWIRGVLKSIRKHGAYMTSQTLTEIWTKPENVMLLLEKLAGEMQARIDMEAEVENLRREAEIVAPKVFFAEAITASEDTILVRELAKILASNGIEIGEKRLYAWLRANKFIIKKEGTDYNTPTQKAMQMGLFEVSEKPYDRQDGKQGLAVTTRVTPKGQEYFINRLLNAKLAAA